MGRERTRRCFAEGCDRRVPPKLLMCAPHWKMVPRALQDAAWRAYRPGQEDDDLPLLPGYLEAIQNAKEHVARLEGETKQRGLFR